MASAQIGLYVGRNRFVRMLKCDHWRMRFNSDVRRFRHDSREHGIWFGDDTSATDLHLLSEIKAKNIYFEGIATDVNDEGYERWIKQATRDSKYADYCHLAIYIPRFGLVFAWMMPREYRTPLVLPGDKIAFESLFKVEIRCNRPKWTKP